MSLVNIGRCLRRTQALKAVTVVLIRNLTQQETSAALRPFYFSVHPDFFCQYPEERLINEESLKTLNQYLESLWSPKHHIHPVNLQFFVRNDGSKATSSLLKEISVSLLSKDVRTTVRDILKSSGLPFAYLESIKPTQARPTNTSNWHSAWCKFYGAPETMDFDIKKKPPQTLSSWLNKNIDLSHKLTSASQPVLQENSCIEANLCRDLGVTGVEWNYKWGPQQYSSCLKSFDRLYRQNTNEKFILALKNHVLSFGNSNGVCVNGKINLSSDDVPQNWINLLHSLPRHFNTLSTLPELEKRVSSLLNGITISRRSTSVMVEEYAHQLTRLIHTLECDTTGLIEGSTRHLKLVVESASGPLTVSQTGHILIQFSCPGFIVKNFIQQKKDESFKALREFHLHNKKEKKIITECKNKLELSSLKRDQSLSAVDVIKCCERLMENTDDVSVSLKGLRLKISQFYSIMQDGEIIIPCSWRSVIK